VERTNGKGSFPEFENISAFNMQTNISNRLMLLPSTDSGKKDMLNKRIEITVLRLPMLYATAPAN